ncbi:FecR family protein [Rhodocytophaga rosea]|uniref:FecR family protein n=1 Tax=Rhodocytophaga rosea TaxID=2704465 RepID=A0A6C0GIA0_9BACT|nr:FecR family protein [Rhodocytophaga rosea]QHT67635.1 FecR family protein [Rhodocytophaga rosea]
MKKEITPELIRKYLAGECSYQEKQLIDDWYASFENEDDYLHSLDDAQKDKLKNRILWSIKQNRQAQGKKATQPAYLSPNKNTTPKKPFFARYAKIAAVLIVALGIAFLMFNIPQQKTPVAEIVPMKKMVNSSNLIKKYTLTDGSTVWLHGHSSISFVPGFKGNKRAVFLAGEAFFEIEKDSLKPFEVHSGNLITRVLGTSFTVKAHEQDSSIEVSVLTGKVSLYAIDSQENKQQFLEKNLADEVPQLILIPNQKGTYSKVNKHLIKEKLPEASKQTVWAETSLSFDNTPVHEVINVLTQKFDIHISIANPDIANCTIKGDFTQQNLPVIIDMICKSIDAEYRMSNNQILIEGEGCQSN